MILLTQAWAGPPAPPVFSPGLLTNIHKGSTMGTRIIGEKPALPCLDQVYSQIHKCSTMATRIVGGKTGRMPKDQNLKRNTLVPNKKKSLEMNHIPYILPFGHLN